MAIALSGGINIWGEFNGSSRANFIDGLTTFLLQAGWALTDEVPASVSFLYGSQPSNGNEVLAGLTYTFVNTLNNAVAGQVLIGATLAVSIQNLVDAIVHTTGAGTEWSTVTPPNTIMTATFDGTATITLLSAFPGPTGNGTPSTYGNLLGGGYKVTGTSPQTGLAATLSTRAYVHDRQAVTSVGSVPLTNVIISNAAETLVSNTHQLGTSPSTVYRVVANRCQFFCYQPGVFNYGGGSIVAAGVPYIAPASACSGDVPQVPTDFSFWVTNDFTDLSGGRTTPRTSSNDLNGGYFTKLDQAAQVFGVGASGAIGGGWASSDAATNTDVTLGDFRLVSLSTPQNYGVGGSTLVDSMKWHGGGGTLGQRMLLEPLVAWSPSGGGPPQVRGQLWDAWLGTDTVPMDTVQKFSDGKYYVAFTHNNAWGTLWLQVPTPTPAKFTSLQASYAN